MVFEPLPRRLGRRPQETGPRRRRVSIALAATAMLALTACGSKPPASSPPPSVPPPPPPPPKTKQLSINVLASAVMNPDVRNRPSPVLVRIYELRSAAQFESLDFLSLHDKDQALLAADILSRDEFVIQPGESRQMRRSLGPESKFVGAIAAFRDLERARWRALVPLATASDNSVAVFIDGLSLRLSGQ
jgi:type VI secretion system protein VasD